MQITSLEYALFFCACFVVSWYLASQNSWRKLVLLLASYGFLALFDVRFAGLVFASSCFNFLMASLVHHAPGQILKRSYLGLALLFNLILLGVFKYYGFFSQSFAPLLTQLGFERDLTWLKLAVPVGISFFTLQAVSYQIDVYRGKIAAEDSLLDLHLLLSFFPKLVAGPLVRPENFLSQFKTKISLTRQMVTSGLVLILIGLVKKLVVADTLAHELVDKVFIDPVGHSSLDVICAVYALAIQLYCDISGYCDLAIGSALLLGVKIRQNFDRPFAARSLVDFWSRWYSSLTRFFVDYVYHPLGGSAGGMLQAGRNIFLTFLFAAWWHGTSLNFVAFFLFHGVFICAELFVARLKPAPVALQGGYGAHPMGQVLTGGDRGLRIFAPVFTTLLTFHLVCFGWVIFKSQDLGTIGQLLNALSYSDMSFELMTPYLGLLMAASFSMHFLPQNFWQMMATRFSNLNAIYVGLFTGLCILAIQCFGSPKVKPFIYSGF